MRVQCEQAWRLYLYRYSIWSLCVQYSVSINTPPFPSNLLANSAYSPHDYSALLSPVSYAPLSPFQYIPLLLKFDMWWDPSLCRSMYKPQRIYSQSRAVHRTHTSAVLVGCVSVNIFCPRVRHFPKTRLQTPLSLFHASFPSQTGLSELSPRTVPALDPP